MTVERPSKSTTDSLLAPYEEIVGVLEDLQVLDDRILVSLSSGSLYFPVDSREARICRQKLAGCRGTKIGILRTPSRTHPIRIRVDEPVEDDR